MPEPLDYAEIPYLQEILNYLPINPTDDEDVITYIQNVTNLITVNYKYGQYQFAYFGIHLLYMTYIYCAVWKISQINPARYKDVIVFARSYSGRERDFKIDDVGSIFAYSLMPEKDIAKIFNIVNLDNSQISNVRDIVDDRNYMAHASGKFDILTEDGYDVKANTVITSIKNIHRCMDGQIRIWFSRVLIDFCIGNYAEYDNPKDIIVEQMIQNFKLSVNELLICNEMSGRDLITEHREFEDKLKQFKLAIFEYCSDLEYI
jgi:hypothetical protein